jgi:ABC-type dipeptide/oligopeptide/nickel transport system permease subunit
VTDLIERPELPTTFRGPRGRRRHDSLWKIRWTLFKRSFKANWKLFKPTRSGSPVSSSSDLGIAAILPTIFFATGYWSNSVYNPVTGLERNPPDVTVTSWRRRPTRCTEIDLRTCCSISGSPRTSRSVTHSIVPCSRRRPTSRHWLGTDPLGRDIMSQLMHGARAAFGLGFSPPP